MKNEIYIDLDNKKETVTNIANRTNSIEIRVKKEKIYNPKVILEKDAISQEVESTYKNNEIYVRIQEDFYTSAGMFTMYISHYEGETERKEFYIENYYEGREIRVKKENGQYKIICLEDKEQGIDFLPGTALELTEQKELNVRYATGLYINAENQLCAVASTLDINKTNYLFGEMLTRQYPQGIECINGLFWTKAFMLCLLKYPFYIIRKQLNSEYEILLGSKTPIKQAGYAINFEYDVYFIFCPGRENILDTTALFGHYYGGSIEIEQGENEQNYKNYYTNIENEIGIRAAALSKVERTNIIEGFNWVKGYYNTSSDEQELVQGNELANKRRCIDTAIDIVGNHMYMIDNLCVQFGHINHTEYKISIIYYRDNIFLSYHIFEVNCGNTTNTTCIPQTFYSHPNANKIRVTIRKHEEEDIEENVTGVGLFAIYDCLLGKGEVIID